MGCPAEASGGSCTRTWTSGTHQSHETGCDGAGPRSQRLLSCAAHHFIPRDRRSRVGGDVCRPGSFSLFFPGAHGGSTKRRHFRENPKRLFSLTTHKTSGLRDSRDRVPTKWGGLVALLHTARHGPRVQPLRPPEHWLQRPSAQGTWAQTGRAGGASAGPGAPRVGATNWPVADAQEGLRESAGQISPQTRENQPHPSCSPHPLLLPPDLGRRGMR